MNKRICDNCNKEIEDHTGFFTVEAMTKERDYGLVITTKIADLCSLKCLIEFTETQRRMSVIREVRKEGKEETISYKWEGKNVTEFEVEKQNFGYILTEESYKKYIKEE